MTTDSTTDVPGVVSSALFSLRPYYEHGGITIYHGDSAEILPKIGKFDLLLTDPPYGVEFKGKATKYTKPSGGYKSGDSEIGPEQPPPQRLCR